MGDIIKRDFGKAEREAARQFARLLKLAEDRDQDILENPIKYFNMASEKLSEQEMFIHRLWEALRLPWVSSANYQPGDGPMQPERLDTVRIDQRDYEAFQAVRRLINSRSQGDG